MNFFRSVIGRFNVVIQRLVEHGIIAYLKEENKKILRSEHDTVDKAIANSVSSVTLNDIQDTFFILIFGQFLAFLSVLIEYGVSRYRRERRYFSH